jgi:proton glutamate symport protein
MSLATKILIGFILGVASGIFCGELITPVGIVGDAFIRLLQMSVLPYIVVSLVLGLGRLSPSEALILFKRAGVLLLVLWIVALAFVLVMPLAYPDWQSGSFFSTSMVEPSRELGLIELFIPANPFNSLAEGIVPAVVLFSIALGVGLMKVEKKEPIIDALKVISKVLSLVTKFVIRFAPLGVFAITARAAGTIDKSQVQGLEVYFLVYLLFWLILGIWLLPMLTASLVPLKYREIMGIARDALITAFATGSVFVVLPILAERSKELVKRVAPESKNAPSIVDVLIPLGYTFPGPGTLLILGFIQFAAWTSGSPITNPQLPEFLSSGFFSLFGSTMVAVPFMLDLLHIPADMFQMYIVSDVFTGRFGMLISGIFMLNWSVLGACAVVGAIKVQKRKLIRLSLLTLTMVFVGVITLRMFFGYAMSREYSMDKKFLNRELLMPSTEQASQLKINDLKPANKKFPSLLDRICSRGVIRVGYFKESIPFAFRNSSGQLVGHDIDLAHILASDLGVRLELVPIQHSQMVDLLSNGDIDIATGIVITPERAIKISFTDPYIDKTLAFVVPDHRRNKFSKKNLAQSRKGLVIAVPNLPLLEKKISHYLKDPKIVIVESPQKFFESKDVSYDALLLSAEAGSAWTLIYPSYSVVVPQPDIVRMPVAFPLASGNDNLRVFLNTWLDIKQRDKTLEKLYNYWVLGKERKDAVPRWSVIRNVLHWVD